VEPADGAVLGRAPASISALLERYPIASPPRSTAGAAVMILLRDGAREVETLLIERTERNEDPASGQVAFPGGHVDLSDDSLLATVLRETEEEVGIGLEDLVGPPHYVGRHHASRFALDVGVFAAELGERSHHPRPRSLEEVAHVFWFPRSALGRTARVPRDTPAGPIEVNAAVYEGHVLWGFTRRLLREFFGHPAESAGPPAEAPPPRPDAIS